MWLSPMREDYLSKLSKKMFHQFVNILCLKFCLIIIIRHKTTSGFPFGENFIPFQVSWRESYCDQSDFPKRSLKYLSSKLSAELRWWFTRITVVWAWVPCRLYFYQLNHCCKICIHYIRLIMKSLKITSQPKSR